MTEQRAEQQITPDQNPFIPPPTDRGSERFSRKQAALSAAICAVLTYGMGEALMQVRNAGLTEFIGLVPASKEGIMGFRIIMGFVSALGAVYGWSMVRSSKIK